jgi:hypothetical protein
VQPAAWLRSAKGDKLYPLFAADTIETFLVSQRKSGLSTRKSGGSE